MSMDSLDINQEFSITRDSENPDLLVCREHENTKEFGQFKVYCYDQN